MVGWLIITSTALIKHHGVVVSNISIVLIEKQLICNKKVHQDTTAKSHSKPDQFNKVVYLQLIRCLKIFKNCA